MLQEIVRNGLFLSLSDTIYEAVILTDYDLHVLYCNNMCSDVFYTDIDELKNHSLTDIFKDGKYKNMLSSIQQGLAGESTSCLVMIKHNKMHEQHLHLTLKKMDGQLLIVVKDISEFADIKSQLNVSAQKYKEFVENIPAIICETDIKGNVVIASNKAYERFGFGKDDIVNGIHIFQFLDKSELSRAVDNFSNIADGALLPPREYKVRTKTGETFYAEVQIEPIVVNNKTIGFRGVIDDISERKEFESKLRKAKDKAEHLNKTKSDFLANFSHEIRTPINAIIGLSSALKSKINDPVLGKHINTINKSGNVLLSLINDILDLSKLEAGKWELLKETVSLNDLMNDIEDIFLNEIEKKNLKLTIDIAPNVPECILTDGVKLRQVLFNLVGNAIKFTNKGRVSIHVSAQQKSDTYELKFAVKDTGSGIPKGQQKLIFKAFEQSSRFNRKEVGTGLGLTIAERIVKMMHGKISLKSELFKGSEFTVIIPGIEQVHTSTKVTMQVPKTNGLKGLKVLVVDDIRANLLTLEAFLTTYGCQVFLADNAKSAYSVINDTRPDIIFMDIVMPDISGVDATRKIHQLTAPEIVPVIAYSANAHQLNEEENVLFDDILLKPIKEVRLLELLHHYAKTNKAGAKHEGYTEHLFPQEIQDEINKNLASTWRKVSEYFVNHDIDFFARELNKIGVKYNNKELINYSENLLYQNKAFNVDEVEQQLKKLSVIIR